MALAERTVGGRVATLVLLLVMAQPGLGPQTPGCRAAGDYDATGMYSYQGSPSSVAPAKDNANAAAAEEAEQPSQQERVQSLTRRAKRLRARDDASISEEEKAYRAGAHRALRKQERLFSSTRLDYRRTRRRSGDFQLVQVALAASLVMVGAALAYKYVRTPPFEKKKEEASKDTPEDDEATQLQNEKEEIEKLRKELEKQKKELKPKEAKPKEAKPKEAPKKEVPKKEVQKKLVKNAAPEQNSLAAAASSISRSIAKNETVQRVIQSGLRIALEAAAVIPKLPEKLKELFLGYVILIFTGFLGPLSRVATYYILKRKPKFLMKSPIELIRSVPEMVIDLTATLLWLVPETMAKLANAAEKGLGVSLREWARNNKMLVALVFLGIFMPNWLNIVAIHVLLAAQERAQEREQQKNKGKKQ